MYQHDPRNIDVLVKDLGLENGNSVQTPATPEVAEEEKPEPLSQVQHHKYRSQVARCLFFSQDRADITFIVNELCHSAESCQVEEACQIPETREAVGTMF